MSVIESLLENLNPKQQDILDKFRERVSDVLQPDHDNFFLLRWLKARNFDLAKSEQMLRKSLIWRRNFGTDEILEWEPPLVLRKYWPGGVFGFDRLGHPILWQLSRQFDARGMMKSVKRSDIIRYHIWRLEFINKLCKEQTKKLGRRIACSVHISDLSGFSLRTVFSPGITAITKEIFALIEANYPENLYASYIINAPGAFPVFFNILKPFLSEDTKRKIHFLGRNWKERIVTEIATPDEIPVFWGGAAREPDDHCSDFISLSVPKLPEEFYVKDQISLDKERMVEMTIQRGGMLQLTYNVNTPNTVIRWAFESEAYDIGFGIYYTERSAGGDVTPTEKFNGKATSSMEEIRQVSRVNSHLVPEDGNIRCSRVGQYVLKFDNSFSWVHSKKMWYEVELLEPADDPLFDNYQPVEDDEILESTYL